MLKIALVGMFKYIPVHIPDTRVAFIRCLFACIAYAISIVSKANRNLFNTPYSFYIISKYTYL